MRGDPNVEQRARDSESTLARIVAHYSHDYISKCFRYLDKVRIVKQDLCPCCQPDLYCQSRRSNSHRSARGGTWATNGFLNCLMMRASFGTACPRACSGTPA